jgi:5-methylcytosine-specific restriction enzyme subunit McrC
MKTLRLREWTTTYGVTLTSAQRDVLRGPLRATVQPTAGASDAFDVTPGNVVGALLVDDVVFLVEPKISISRVLFLLAYAADPSAWRDDASAQGDTTELISGVAELHTRLCERALRRGVLAGYHNVEAELYTVRGRVDLAEQLRRRPGLDLPLAVRFDEHDEDIVENRLLLAATMLLRRLPLRNANTRRALHRLAESLQLVTAMDFPPKAVPDVTWTRLNEHYRPAVELSRLLLRLRSVDLIEGTSVTSGFTINMAALFEEFVRNSLRDALPATPGQFPSGFELKSLALDVRGRVRLRPDLSYWPQAQCTFIGDVKYKRDSGAGHNDDLYQLLAYATAARLNSATLVYADGPPEPTTHHVVGADVELHVLHLDLTKMPVDLLAQVHGLADVILESPS